MSVENGKVCCNCRHCKRIRQYSQIDEREVTVCHCEVDHCYLGYIEVMTYRCRHWAREKDKEGADNE